MGESRTEHQAARRKADSSAQAAEDLPEAGSMPLLDGEKPQGCADSACATRRGRILATRRSPLATAYLLMSSLASRRFKRP